MSEPELHQLTRIVESRGKMEELAKVLEVSKTLKSLKGNSDASYETLLWWSAEMQTQNINIRAHLIHHLKTIGVNDAATKYASLHLLLLLLFSNPQCPIAGYHWADLLFLV